MAELINLEDKINTYFTMNNALNPDLSLYDLKGVNYKLEFHELTKHQHTFTDIASPKFNATNMYTKVYKVLDLMFNDDSKVSTIEKNDLNVAYLYAHVLGMKFTKIATNWNPEDNKTFIDRFYEKTFLNSDTDIDKIREHAKTTQKNLNNLKQYLGGIIKNNAADKISDESLAILKGYRKNPLRYAPHE